MASQARRTRRITRKLGAPTKDDQVIIDLAAAFQKAWGLSQRMSIDLALAFLEADIDSPSKIPRRARSRSRPRRGSLVGYKLPYATFRGRESTIRKKIAAGAKARPQYVLEFVVLLRAKSIYAVQQYARLLRTLPERKARIMVEQLLGIEGVAR